MKTSTLLLVTTAFSLLLSCRKDNPVADQPEKVVSSDYYVLDVTSNKPRPGLVFLKTSSYQQTTDYTCGPSAVITLLRHYGKTGDEMIIAGEMGTSSTCGTTPAQMSDWLNTHGFKASWHQNGNLDSLVINLKKNIPTLVEWSDWGGHWVLVTGYDTRNTPALSDDVIIFADPYDRHDDNMDGYTWFNAERFYYMWYDALLFGTVMKRIYITADPL